MAESRVDFLHDRPVPAGTRCQEHREPICDKSAMMLVRMDGQEHFVCYEHLSWLYNRLHARDGRISFRRASTA
jgi:hypothetical protein